jgi:hypothetical protein
MYVGVMGNQNDDARCRDASGKGNNPMSNERKNDAAMDDAGLDAVSGGAGYLNGAPPSQSQIIADELSDDQQSLLPLPAKPTINFSYDVSKVIKSG